MAGHRNDVMGLLHAIDMRLFVALLACALAVAGWVQPARADEPVDDIRLGGDIADICTTADRTAALACSAYLRGTVDGLLTAQVTASDSDIAFCTPDAIGADEIRQAFLDFVGEDPERRDEDAGLVLLSALEDHFPCDAGSNLDTTPDRAAYRQRHRRAHPAIKATSLRSPRHHAITP
jgi:hypothetical protein